MSSLFHRWAKWKLDKEDVAHIFSGIVLNHENEIVPFVEMWVDLETVIQSEVSQKEKNKYCVLTHREQGTLFNALWWPKWEGNPQKRGYM